MKHTMKGAALAFLFALGASLAVYAEEKKAGELVEVREIPAATLDAIRMAQAVLDRANEELSRAQKAARYAAEDLAAARKEVPGGASSFESDCQRHANGWSGFKRFRRLTINGKFVLIHEGQEECYFSNGFITLTTPTSSGLEQK